MVIDLTVMPDLVCGQTYRDPRSEERVAALRDGEITPFTGCGAQLVWLVAYRCRQCARWMHGTCLDRHFEEDARCTMTDDEELAAMEAAIDAYAEHHVVPFHLTAPELAIARAMWASGRDWEQSRNVQDVRTARSEVERLRAALELFVAYRDHDCSCETDCETKHEHTYWCDGDCDAALKIWAEAGTQSRAALSTAPAGPSAGSEELR